VSARGWRRALTGLALLLGLLALRVALWRPYPVAGPAPADGFRRVVGVVHVHTTLSDGAASPAQVIEAARAAGLDFLAITDHNNLDAKAVEGRHQGVLVLVGTEISTNAGHLLGLGLPDPPFRFSGDVDDALGDVRDLGGVAFAAHPLSPREDFRWTGWDRPGAWGLELVNGDSQWREAGWSRLLGALLLYPFNHEYALLSSLTPPTELLSRWDRVLAERPAPAIVGADAHGRLPLTRRWALRIPGYAEVFSVARNHVLLNGPWGREPAADARRLVEALGAGRCYMALDGLAPGDGFSFVAENAGGRWTMGDAAPAELPLRFRAGGRVPGSTRIALLRDGRPVAEGVGSLDATFGEPGVYRVEARLPGWPLPWILSNPIAVFPPEVAALRAARASGPAEPVAPALTRVLEDFEGPQRFRPESDPGSSVELDVDPADPPEGRLAGRMRFRLGTPGPGRPVWCALMRREALDLTGTQGLALWVRADGVFRFFLQLRDENPRSADEGTEWWSASVKTSPQWRRVAIPFARMRSTSPVSDHRLDLGRLRGLGIVIDVGSEKPGTSGTIWLDGVGAY